MNPLKRLITVKPREEETKIESKVQELANDPVSYSELGAKQCIEANGHPDILRNSLWQIFENFKEDSRRATVEQELLKRPIVDEQTRKKTELNQRNVYKELKEKAVEELTKEIKQIDIKISEVNTNPQGFGLNVDKKPKAQFYIGLLILLPITLYLIVFYISASYSAFFKEFSPDTNIFAAIFDGQALSKAYNDLNGGLLELIYICTIPFAFMGLGYLIHMFQKSKRQATLKITSLLGVTFIFDVILAYQIEKKIFDFEKLPGEIYNVNLAFQSAEFWGIIFAGFVVYVIWGLVFDFVMKEYENIDTVKNFTNSLKNEKQSLIDEKKLLKELVENITDKITNIEQEINELQFQIDGFIFEKRRYLHYHTQYLAGWTQAIGRDIALPNEQQSKLIQSCNEVSDQHLIHHQISMIDAETIIFK